MNVFSSKTVQATPEEVLANREAYAQKSRDWHITSIALGIIALSLFAVSYSLFGIGTLPPTVIGGLGIIPYIGGVFLGCLGLSLLCSAVVTLTIASVRSYQHQQWLNTSVEDKAPSE